MKKYYFLLASILPYLLFSQDAQPLPQGIQEQQSEIPLKTPEQIQQELTEDEALFKRAQEMFNPWYTGPLLTPSATMMAPGYGNIQPYIFVTDTYAAYNNDRKSVSLPSNKVSLNPQIGGVFGVTDTMDISIALQAFGNWQYGTSGGGFGDISVKLGWPILRQTLHLPAIKFSLSQTFPTGRYQKLNPHNHNLSATGGGVWATQFGLAISKVMFWSYNHPLNARLYVGYTVSVPSTVHGFNTYGGGYGARAKVHPGNALIADLGLEWSLTQNWVISNDLVYTCQNKTTFSGNPGTLADGRTPSTEASPYNDSLSLAPALEYNFSPNLGILGGVWFTVYGKNSANFISGILSVSWVFGPM